LERVNEAENVRKLEITKMEITAADWKKLKYCVLKLEQKWFELIPKSKLGKMINLVRQNSATFVENLRAILTPPTFHVVRALSENLTENCAICLLDEMEKYLINSKKTEISNKPVNKSKRPKFLKKSQIRKRKYSEKSESSGLNSEDAENWKKSISRHFGNSHNFQNITI